MPLVPFSRFAFDSDLTPDQLRKCLEEIVAEAVTHDGRPLAGTVMGDAFELRARQRPLHRVPYLATLRGRIFQSGERSRVEGAASVKLDELAILAILVVAALATGILEDRAGIAFALAMATFYHAGGMVFGFTPTRDSLLETMRRVVGEHAAEPVARPAR